MPVWTTSVVLNEDGTNRIGTIYSYDARKNIPNIVYYEEIKELYEFKKDWNGNELSYNLVKDNIEEEIEDGHFTCPRKFDYDEDFDEDKEKENLGHHINKMIINDEILYYKDNYDGLKNINKRLMNETLEQLQYNTDNPNTLLGKLCIRMNALEMFEDWNPNDFPNIPSYE